MSTVAALVFRAAVTKKHRWSSLINRNFLEFWSLERNARPGYQHAW